jgi:hypothetical protein
VRVRSLGHRQIIDKISTTLSSGSRGLVDTVSIICRYFVEYSSMGLCPSPPGSGLPSMDIPSGPWEKAMDGGGQPKGLPNAPPTAFPHLPTPAGDNAAPLLTNIFVCLLSSTKHAAASREGAGFRRALSRSRCPKPRQGRGEAVAPAPVGVPEGQGVSRRRSANGR